MIALKLFKKKSILMLRLISSSAALSMSILGCQTSITARSINRVGPSSTYDAKGDYRVGKGDELLLRVQGDESMSGPLVVQDSGVINLPLGGTIEADGLTIRDIRSKLEKHLATYVLRPRISVVVSQKRSYKAYFTGEFLKVGPIQLDERINLLHGISLAGGLTPYATKRIVIIRKSSGSSGHERFAVDYDDILQGRDGLDSFFIERGDSIVAE